MVGYGRGNHDETWRRGGEGVGRRVGAKIY